MINSADVVVIGGGIIGTSAAFHLTKLGVQRVVLVEKDYLAAGASGRSSAILRQHYGLSICGQMAHWSLQVWRNFDDVVGGDPGFMPVGYLMLAGPEDRATLEGIIAHQEAQGINTRLISLGEARALAPGIRLDGVAAVGYEPDTGCVDPVAAVGLFAAAAERGGATILQGTRVESVRVSGGRVTGVVTNRGAITAGAVLCAANGWTPAIARPLGLTIPIDNCRQEVGLVRRAPDQSAPHPIISDAPQEGYFRPHPGGLTYLGSSASTGYSDFVDPDAFDATISAETFSRRRRMASARFEPMERAIPRGGYAAFYDMSPDRQFILDRAETVEGFAFACGFSGHGFKHAPIVGKMLAELVTQGRASDFDMRIFRLGRFAEGRPLVPEFQYRSSDGLR